MLLKAAPSLAEPPVFHNEKDEGESLVFFVLPKLILRRPQNRTEAEQGIIRAC